MRQFVSALRVASPLFYQPWFRLAWDNVWFEKILKQYQQGQLGALLN
jgi:hypothetical protein